MLKFNLKKHQYEYSFMYEFKPYFLLCVGLYAIAFPVSQFMVLNGALLIILSAIISRARLKYRGYIA